MPTTDWLGSKMDEFVGDIKKLGKIVEGLYPVIDLLIYLGGCPYPKREICEPLFVRLVS
jgi:hypothetical protein